LPPTVRVGKKRPDRLATEVRRTEIGARNARRGRSVDEKLREVAFVRAHRVRRRVAIKSEKLEKRFEVFGQRRPGPPSTPRARQAPARRSPASSPACRAADAAAARRCRR